MRGFFERIRCFVSSVFSINDKHDGDDRCPAVGESQSGNKSDSLYYMTDEEYAVPFSPEYSYLEEYKKITPGTGPYFPDGSINWQCDCMGGGSMVAHRCGHYFRRLYECMSKKSDDPNDESEIKCPKEFVSWAACIKGLSDEERRSMKKRVLGSL